MTATARLPFFATPTIVASKAPPSTATFGYVWQDVVTRVEGFVIAATNEKIVGLRNISHEESRASLGAYSQSCANHVFLLHPSDAAFEADDGVCINALCGKCSPTGCSELGVVFAPTAIALEGHSLRLPRTVAVSVAVDPDSAPSPTVIRTAGLAPRAVVVRTAGSAIVDVCVVTEAEYDRIARSPQSFEHEGDELWLVLVEGERIHAVGVQIEHKRLQTIRFRTTLQTSAVFGVENAAQVQWLTSEGEQTESYVCGFEYELASEKEADVENWIRRFAVLCTTPLSDSTDLELAVKRQRL